MAKPRIVILGAGLGGAIAAFEVKNAVGETSDVSVVSQGDTFQFVPWNPWFAGHWHKREAMKRNRPRASTQRGGECQGWGETLRTMGRAGPGVVVGELQAGCGTGSGGGGVAPIRTCGA